MDGLLTYTLAVLSKSHVSMLLDVATILRDEPLELVMAVWREWHSAAATTYYKDLARRCLLEADEEGKLVMHDVLAAALGRDVILHSKPGLEEHFGSRVWVQDGKVMGLEQVWLPPRASLPWLVMCMVLHSLSGQHRTPLQHSCRSSDMYATVVMNTPPCHIGDMVWGSRVGGNVSVGDAGG
jgi:hypothetical protein